MTKHNPTPDAREVAARALAATEAEQLRAEQRLAAAVEHEAGLRERNAAGDDTVTGLARVAAEYDVSVARELLDHAAEQVEFARLTLAAVIADEVADDVAPHLPDAVDQTLLAAVDQVRAAVAALAAVLPERDRQVDAAGRRLHEVGAPPRTPLGRTGLRYAPVRTYDGRRDIPGQYNLWVGGQSVAHRQDHGDTKRATCRLVEDAFRAALRGVGMELGTTGVNPA